MFMLFAVKKTMVMAKVLSIPAWIWDIQEMTLNQTYKGNQRNLNPKVKLLA